jgi:hypothetical protein
MNDDSIPLLDDLDGRREGIPVPGRQAIATSPGEHVLRKGEQGNSMFLILGWRGRRCWTIATGTGACWARLGPGSLFGEGRLPDGHARSAEWSRSPTASCWR